uniref:Chordin-like protein 2 isoform X2 n=1 Tax=Geotrypetes seraphini TaxID=260995 RepID=A0A6P8RIP1_GEOSA|nr:chordin-like protein 2 isoform X2 [Geotrypetes seraphini]
MAPDLREVWLLLGFSALLLASETEGRARARPDMFCIFHGKRYRPGESWHPYLEPYGLMYCLHCLCSQNASVSCHRIKCPPLHCISTMTEPHQCCPRCVEPHTPSGLRAPMKSCQYNGTVYQQGEMFTASDFFPARQPDQCVLCSCSDGQIYCGLMTCPEVVCPFPLSLMDFCCRVCKESSIEKSVEEERLQLNRGVRYSQDQCLSELLNKRSFGATASSISSSSLGINTRTFKQKGGGTTIKILFREKHKKDQEPKGEPEKGCNRKKSFRRGRHFHLETARRSLECLQEDPSNRELKRMESCNIPLQDN